MSTVRNLSCCVCDGDAGRFEQHWNRDTGFGVCASCVAWVRSRGETEAEIRDLYGVEGVNFAKPAEAEPMSYATALDAAEAKADQCGRAYVYRHRSEAAGYYVSTSRLDAPLCVTVERDSAGIVFTGGPATQWEQV